MRKGILVISTALAVLTTIAWLDSYTWSTSPTGGGRLLMDELGWQGRGYLVTDTGSLYLALVFPIDPQRDARDDLDKWTAYEFASVRMDLQPMGDEKHIYLDIPFWVFLVLSAAYPTIALIRGPFRRYRRRKRGLCLKCGYNLTGNTSGICPECGSELSEQEKTSSKVRKSKD